MDKEVLNKMEVEEADDLNLKTGFDDFDMLSVAAEAAQAQRKRFLLVCDATSSMGAWWSAAQKALEQAVDEISSRTPVGFQVKVVAYRDHTCDPIPKEESEWSSDTMYLKNFIGSIESDGGGDLPESIGVGLKPALQSGATMVILIGDAPGRRESTGFEEAKILGQDKCPIYALYTTHRHGTKEHFERLAKLSGGKAMLLSNAGSMTDIFAALLAKVVFQISYQPTSIEGKRIMEGT